MTGSESTARPWWPRLRSLVEPALVVVTVAALVLGGVAWLIGWRAVADGCWVAGTLAAVVPAVVWVIAALRRGRAGVDLLAVLSLVGTLLVGEYVAGALIAVMLSTGRALDAAAQRRASHDLRALLKRAPRSARRRIGDAVTVVPLGEVAVGDLLVVGPGEVVPVDGRIEGTVAVLDESVLTGEPLQVERAVGEPVRSGVVNAATAFSSVRRPPPSRAPTPGSCGWRRRRAPKARRLFGWPTGTRRGLCRWRSWWPAWPGWLVGRRCGRWRCWSWRRRVRCCSRRRWRSSPVCRGPLGRVW